MIRAALALTALLALAACQALWDTPGQMREPYAAPEPPCQATEEEPDKCE